MVASHPFHCVTRRLQHLKTFLFALHFNELNGKTFFTLYWLSRTKLKFVHIPWNLRSCQTHFVLLNTFMSNLSKLVACYHPVFELRHGQPEPEYSANSSTRSFPSSVRVVALSEQPSQLCHFQRATQSHTRRIFSKEFSRLKPPPTPAMAPIFEILLLSVILRRMLLYVHKDITFMLL